MLKFSLPHKSSTPGWAVRCLSVITHKRVVITHKLFHAQAGGDQVKPDAPAAMNILFT